ncbi:MAG: PASTA domain-containing protein [Deltaproteobacteria bacterium]|nr:PASTA domain-containing protein [Deltaproteobacteria bacterium]
MNLRIYLVLGFFILFFSAILFRAFQLQVLDTKDLKSMAMRQHKRTVNVQSKRGDIYDRNSKELAVSIEVDSVYAQPGKIESPRSAAKALAPVLSMDRREIEKKIRSATNFVWLKRQVDLRDEERKAVAELEGVGIMKESRRYYPNRQLASNLIGFTGLDANGLEGIELHYDGMLKGASHKFVGDRDARGRMIVFEDFDKTVPVQGMEVELTIDKTIQYVAEKALRKAVEASGAKAAEVLVMNPTTGEVLAMASMPTFDPNDFSSTTPRHWRNRAVTDVFEPGSVFKLFLISAAIEENAVRPQDGFFCENGSYGVADRVFHDHDKYGWLTVAQIIKYSSNIGSAKIGDRLGKNRLYRYLKAYGFGDKTGIDLPGESAGSLRPLKNWSDVTLATISFGQGVSVTGLQLITALSAVANGGFLMKPYVVKSVRDANGKVVSETNPTIVRRVISEETARKMTDMLVSVTHEGGTGVKASLDEFEVAGKTGTAQKPDFKHGGYLKGAFVASFFGFVPARSPRLAILVAIDEPNGEHYGGTIAGPVFKEIAEKSLSYMGVFRERKGSTKVEFVEADAAKSTAKAGSDEEFGPAAVPDFTGKTVRSVLRMAKGRSFDVNVMGSGKAVSQKPAPGQNLPTKGPVVVFFQ